MILRERVKFYFREFAKPPSTEEGEVFVNLAISMQEKSLAKNIDPKHSEDVSALVGALAFYLFALAREAQYHLKTSDFTVTQASDEVERAAANYAFYKKHIGFLLNDDGFLFKGA